jgi:hypothetical protein
MSDEQNTPAQEPQSSAPEALAGEAAGPGGLATAPRASRPDDLLPPVEPPSAGFIVKLFLVPALIVSLVVFVVFAFNWLVHLGSNPQGYLDDMERGAANAWQRAHDFASEMRGNPQLRKDSQVAGRVVNLLERHLTQPLGDGNSKGTAEAVQYRYFLCMALGQFEVPSGLPVLMQVAARPATNDNELRVRLAAIESLAVLIDNIRKNDPAFVDGQLLQLLLDLSSQQDEPEPMVRTRAAFALGVYGGDKAKKRLEEMIDAFREPAPEARFNAATGLARLGDAACVPVLIEMLDPELQLASDTAELGTAERQAHQHWIQANGLKATEMLLTANPEVDTTKLREAVQRLHDTPNLLAPLKLRTQEVLNLMDQRKPAHQ